MTLVISGIWRGHTLQVSDRLVMARRGRVDKAHDPAANKTVVVRGHDYCISMSYSGLAYIGDTPTDTFIAEQVLNGPQEHTFNVQTRSRPNSHAQAVVERVRDGITAAYAKLPSPAAAQPLRISIVGVQGRGDNRNTDILWNIDKEPSDPDAHLTKLDLTLLRAGDICTSWNGTYPPDEQSTTKALFSKATSFDGLVDEMVASVVRTSHQVCVVGPDVMIVTFGPEANRIVCEFRPLEPPAMSARPREKVTADNFPSIDVEALIQDAAMVYSPWVITPTTSMKPSLYAAGENEWVTQDEITIIIKGPADPAGRVRTLFTGQERPGPPR